MTLKSVIILSKGMVMKKHLTMNVLAGFLFFGMVFDISVAYATTPDKYTWIQGTTPPSIVPWCACYFSKGPVSLLTCESAISYLSSNFTVDGNPTYSCQTGDPPNCSNYMGVGPGYRCDAMSS